MSRLLGKIGFVMDVKHERPFGQVTYLRGDDGSED